MIIAIPCCTLCGGIPVMTKSDLFKLGYGVRCPSLKCRAHTAYLMSPADWLEHLTQAGRRRSERDASSTTVSFVCGWVVGAAFSQILHLWCK